MYCAHPKFKNMNLQIWVSTVVVKHLEGVAFACLVEGVGVEATNVGLLQGLMGVDLQIEVYWDLK